MEYKKYPNELTELLASKSSSKIRRKILPKDRDCYEDDIYNEHNGESDAEHLYED